MKCPRCGERRLRVDIAFTGRVACAFPVGRPVELLEDVQLDSAWNNESCCECLDCRWIGTAGDARIADAFARLLDEPRPPGNARRAVRGVEDIKRRLAAGDAPAGWQPEIEWLVAEVERLSAKSPSVPERRRAAADDDTVY